MILDLVLLLMVAAIVLFIIALFEQSVIMTSISLLFWIICLVQTMYIEVPYVAGVAVGTSVNFTEGAHTYMEVPLSIICFGIIIIHIILLIRNIFQFMEEGKYRY